MRHCHFAEASNKITEYCDELQSKSGGKGRNQNVKEMDLKSMAKLVRNLPKYQDDLRSLNVHVDIASALNKQIDSGRLTEFGALEQVCRVTQGCVPVMASAFASMFSSGVSAPPCLDYFRLHRPAALPPLAPLTPLTPLTRLVSNATGRHLRQRHIQGAHRVLFCEPVDGRVRQAPSPAVLLCHPPGEARRDEAVAVAKAGAAGRLGDQMSS